MFRARSSSAASSRRTVPSTWRYFLKHTEIAYARPAYWATSVPAAMPSKPMPPHPKMPKVSTTDAQMLVILTTRSVHIELIESCIPTNQPRNTISPRVAGTAQMRTLK